MLRRISAIKSYNIVSFDIFDTLIERTVWVPQKVFEIAGVRVLGEQGSSKFCSDRIVAEKRAREKSETGEVTIVDIYNNIDGYEKLRDKLMQEEIAVELETCRGKSKGIELYKMAKQSAKKVVLVSDMYLPGVYLGNMLRKCGIEGYDKLYVSCEKGVSKRTGLLFKYVLSDMNIRASEMVHIGDDYKSDVNGAKMWGVDSVWQFDVRCLVSKVLQKIRVW